MKRTALLLCALTVLITSCAKLHESPTQPRIDGDGQPKAELPKSTDAGPLAVAVATPLENNVPVAGISDIKAGLKYYSIDVPAGQTQLTIRITGSSGDCDLYVKFGAEPTTTVWDYRPYSSSSNETVTVSNPAAGTWYVMLRGYTAYSGVTLTASYVAGPAGKPDLTVHAASANPFIETRTFAPNHCAVLEGSVVAGTRRLLRFSGESRNRGTADLVLGAPADNPELFEYDLCHGHYHYQGFLLYRLLDSAGGLVAGGQKVAFCLEDFAKFDSAAGPAKFSCSYQGISVGWSDIYSGTLDGQWIDITDVAPGTYRLEMVVDPNDDFVELSESNNSGSINVTIPPPTADTATPLTSGVPVTGLSGAAGSLAYYKITVPAGSSLLSVSTSGGTGDLDLYVKSGAQPTPTAYQFRSWGNSNSESVTASFPTATDWYITVHGYKAYSGATLVATVSAGGPTPTTLVNGVPVTGLGGAGGSLAYYKITVGSGSPVLTITTSGGTGDVDLYVKYGSQPTTSSFGYRSWNTNNAESVQVAAPLVGDWYITLHGYSAYSGVTLLGSTSNTVVSEGEAATLQVSLAPNPKELPK